MTLPELKTEIASLLTRAMKSGLMVEVASYNADDNVTRVEQVTVENLFGYTPLIVINHDPDFVRK